MSDQKNKLQQFLQQNKYLIISLSVLTLVGVTAGGVALYNSQTRGNGEPQIVAYESKPTTKPTNSTDIKTLASARLKQLTGGVDLETIEASTTTKATNTDSNPAQNPAPAMVPTSPTNSITTSPKSINSGSAQGGVIVDEQKAQQIIQENNIKDNLAFYTKSESILPTFDSLLGASGYFGWGNGIDYSKPIETETWTSANYYKSITRQNGEIKDFYLSTPEFYLTYVGGKYAIQQNYDQKQYFGGLYEGNYENPEISFLKYILSQDSNLTNIGRQTVDGKDLVVYEFRFQNDYYPRHNNVEINYVTRYYVDDVNFILYLVENLENEVVTYRNKTLDSKQLSGDTIVTDIYNRSQIIAIPVKETTIRPYQYNPEDYYVQTFIKKYDIYYADQISSTYLGASDYQLWQDDEYHKLSYTKDFNPYLSEEYLNSLNNYPIAGYYQEFASYEIRLNPYQVFNEYESVQNEQTIVVDLGEKQFPGKYFEVTYNYDSGINEYRNYYIEFQVGNLWYSLNQWDLGYAPVQIVKQNPVKLVKMTPQKAQEIDQMNAPSVQYPEIMPITIDDQGGN